MMFIPGVNAANGAKEITIVAKGAEIAGEEAVFSDLLKNMVTCAAGARKREYSLFKRGGKCHTVPNATKAAMAKRLADQASPEFTIQAFARAKLVVPVFMKTGKFMKVTGNNLENTIKGLEKLRQDPIRAGMVTARIGGGKSVQTLIADIDIGLGNGRKVRFDQQGVSGEVAQIAIQVNGEKGMTTIAQCATIREASGELNLQNLIKSLKQANGKPID